MELPDGEKIRPRRKRGPAFVLLVLGLPTMLCRSLSMINKDTT